MTRFGIVGSGSWATALAKILTDNKSVIHWWVRSEATQKHLQTKHHNPNYISSIDFDPSLFVLSQDVSEVIKAVDIVLIAVPSAYVVATIKKLDKHIFKGKKIISAVKGILPDENLLLNEYLKKKFNVSLNDYFTVMGPCHAEEVASEKLSYLTFSGTDEAMAQEIASFFSTDYISTIVNNDVFGVQYAAVLKNIYALGAGIAHGLEYGDNFLSVFIANCADEMAVFLRKVGIARIEVGVHDGQNAISHKKNANYAASVYLGDLLVTCYSLHSRNRSFGNMIGKGYSVRAAKLELNMVAEGYNASRCIFQVNKTINAEMPIAETVYRVLWENVKVGEAFKQLEALLV